MFKTYSEEFQFYSVDINLSKIIYNVAFTNSGLISYFEPVTFLIIFAFRRENLVELWQNPPILSF